MSIVQEMEDDGAGVWGVERGGGSDPLEKSVCVFTEKNRK